MGNRSAIDFDKDIFHIGSVLVDITADKSFEPDLKLEDNCKIPVYKVVHDTLTKIFQLFTKKFPRYLFIPINHSGAI